MEFSVMLGIAMAFFLGMGIMLSLVFSGSSDVVYTFFGFMLIIVAFALLFTGVNNGYPVTRIGPGEYQVAFVYVAGEKVSVGIEDGGRNDGVTKTFHLVYYQFPRKAFAGEIDTGARKLVVEEVRGYRRTMTLTR